MMGSGVECFRLVEPICGSLDQQRPPMPMASGRGDSAMHPLHMEVTVQHKHLEVERAVRNGHRYTEMQDAFRKREPKQERASVLSSWIRRLLPGSRLRPARVE